MGDDNFWDIDKREQAWITLVGASLIILVVTLLLIHHIKYTEYLSQSASVAVDAETGLPEDWIIAKGKVVDIEHVASGGLFGGHVSYIVFENGQRVRVGDSALASIKIGHTYIVYGRYYPLYYHIEELTGK